MACAVFKAGGPAKLLRGLMKNMGYLARYMRQPMTWVENLTGSELKEWMLVTAEILGEEGGRKASDVDDPVRAFFGVGDD